MKSFHPFMLTALAPLALCACSENAADEAAPAEAVEGSAAFDGSAPIDAGEANEALPDEAVFDGSGTEETVFEGNPEIGGTEPMDSAEPMGGTEPMDEGLGSDDGASEE